MGCRISKPASSMWRRFNVLLPPKTRKKVKLLSAEDEPGLLKEFAKRMPPASIPAFLIGTEEQQAQCSPPGGRVPVSYMEQAVAKEQKDAEQGVSQEMDRMSSGRAGPEPRSLKPARSVQLRPSKDAMPSCFCGLIGLMRER